jgi:2-polyprenyl-6-methoxyphenol hydroxylase-like FAD-dependent oxidoreductase
MSWDANLGTGNDAETRAAAEPGVGVAEHVAEAEVVIVGAGPTGLLLAGDLAVRGISCTVLERRADPPDTTTTRAFAVHARTLEQLDARGLADRLIATGTTVGGLALYGRVEISFADLPTRFPYLLVTPQYQVERLLEERAVAAGARIVRGVRVLGLSQDADGVSVRAERMDIGAGAQGTDAAESVFRANYVVGTDGVRSTVREALGLPFPGRPVVRSIMLADVRFAEPPQDVLSVRAVGDAFAFIAPFGDGWHRVFCWNWRHQVPDSAPLELEEIREVLARAFGTDFGLAEARWMSRFHSDERQAPKYRVGRVFLAGDAAHCHSPAGGQGMNTGLQDAANLGWKLAAALRGRAADPEWLLDSYQAERHPVGRQVLRSSGALVRLALVKPWLLRVARDVLSGLVLRIPAIAHAATGTVSGIGIRYAEGRAEDLALTGIEGGATGSQGQLTGNEGRLTDDGGRLTGSSGLGTGGAPTRLYELLRDGRFVLVGRSAQDGGVTESWKGDVEYAASAQVPHALELVRPDGYVAWTSDEADPEARAAAAREALTQWCGASAA